ncbi:CD209 antigen-like [Notolabrus celidotus]|uniref:CD209 antigen-like n=1 Tax=Notolabrus celidotus TaxID=1203425 RepID=UPI00148FDCA3|nr:CD209 antigen-like [Notolabrus celidotus]
MAVKYHASTVTNLESDNSKIDYKQPVVDGSKFQHLVHALRNNPFRVATLCLSLLCLLLLFGVIGQSVHYRKVEQDHQNQLTAMSKDKEDLQGKLKTEQKEGADIEISCNKLTDSISAFFRKRDQLQANTNSLRDETDSLRASESQLQASHTTLSKEVEQLKTSKEQLQNANNVLSKERDLLHKQYDADLKLKNELHASYESVTKERDNFQNIFNFGNRSEEELRKSYMEQVKKLERLQERHNFSTYESDKLASSHQDLTNEIIKLQDNYQILRVRENILYQNLSKTMPPSRGLECNIQTEEREKLQKINDDLTEERDQLQGGVEGLKATINGKTCQTGWRSFENSCYFTYTVKKTWSQARESCQNIKAELTIVKSQQEMNFVNSLYGSDQEVWIGLSDGGVEGQWKWVDGTPLTTTFWGKGQPNSHNGKNQDCVEFWHRANGMGEWNDESCSIRQYFMCEI